MSHQLNNAAEVADGCALHDTLPNSLTQAGNRVVCSFADQPPPAVDATLQPHASVVICQGTPHNAGVTCAHAQQISLETVACLQFWVKGGVAAGGGWHRQLHSVLSGSNANFPWLQQGTPACLPP